jgi:hypothetical protein
MQAKLFTRALLGLATCASAYAVSLVLEEPALASGSCKTTPTTCQVGFPDSYEYGVCNSVAVNGNCLCIIGTGSGLTPSPANACQNP